MAPSFRDRLADLRHLWLEPDVPLTTAAVAAVAAAARLLYWLSMRDTPLMSDAGQYHELATNLAHGLGFSHTLPQIELHPTAFRPPGYPFLLSLVYRVLGATPGVGRATAVVTGVAVAVAVVAVVRRHAGDRAGLAAGAAVALYPPLVANDTVTLTEGLSLLLLVLLIDAVLRRSAVTAGLLCGLLVLTRPSAQFLVIIVAVWLGVKVDWRRGALAVAVTVAVVAPWVVRNTAVLGAPVIVTSNGFNMAAMYSRPAQTTDNFVDPLVDPYFSDLRLLQFDEVGWDRALRDRALADLRANPTHVVHVLARNAGALSELNPRLNGIAEVLDGRNTTVRIVTMPLFYLGTVAGAVGLWRRRRDLGLLLALVGGNFLAGSLVLVSAPRLRAPVDLVMCIGIGLLAAGRPSGDHAPAPDGAGSAGAVPGSPPGPDGGGAPPTAQTSPANASV